MAKATKEPSTSGNTSPPEGKRHELSINIQRAQRVSLTWMRAIARVISIQQAREMSLTGQPSQPPRLLARTGGIVRATVAGVVDAVVGVVDTAMARLRPGRPPEYDVDGAITGIAKDCATKDVEVYFRRFVERVRHECKNKRPRIKTPGRTRMNEICRPVWEAARRDQLAKK